MSRVEGFPEEAIKSPCIVSSSADITLSGEQIIGSTSVVDGDRVLARSQTDASENGIYIVSTSDWSRSTDWNDANDVGNGVMCSDEANGILYFATFTGTFSPDSTEVTFTKANTSGGLSSSYMTLDGDNIVTGNVKISQTSFGIVVEDGYVDMSDSPGLYFPAYSTVALANTAININFRPGTLYLSSHSNDLQFVYWNAVNWKRPSDGGNANS